MKKSRRAALNLSVNAIVVFVLAFAMLGVGIAFVNIIRENIIGVAGDIIDVEDLDRPPSADEPLTVSNRISISSNEGTEEAVGFYNRANHEVTNVQIGISDCASTGGGEIGNNDEYVDSPIEVSSLPTNVERGEGEGFLIYIDPVDDWAGGETYICTMVAYSSNDDPWSANPDDIYEQESFYLDVLE